MSSSYAPSGSAGYIYRHGWIPVAGTGAVDKRSRAKQQANPTAPMNPDHAEATQKAIEKHMAEVEVKTAGGSGSVEPGAVAPSPASDFSSVARDANANGDWKLEDEEQSKALRRYTGSTYEDINNALRGKWESSASVDRLVGHIDAAFEAAPPLTRGIRVSRWMDGDGPFPASPPPMKPGAVFRDEAYVSTTKAMAAASAFGSTKIVVRVPAGNKVIDMNHATKSQEPQEHEVLLPRGSKFRVVEDRLDVSPNVDREIVVEVI